MHAVSSTPIRSKDTRIGIPHLRQRHTTRGSIYAVPLSPDVSPVGKSNAFSRECSSPIKGAGCAHVDVVAHHSPPKQGDRESVSQRFGNHHAVHPVRNGKQQHMLNKIQVLTSAQRSPEYLPLVIVSDDEGPLATKALSKTKVRNCSRKPANNRKVSDHFKTNSCKGPLTRCDSVDSGKGGSTAVTSTGIRTHVTGERQLDCSDQSDCEPCSDSGLSHASECSPLRNCLINELNHDEKSTEPQVGHALINRRALTRRNRLAPPPKLSLKNKGAPHVAPLASKSDYDYEPLVIVSEDEDNANAACSRWTHARLKSQKNKALVTKMGNGGGDKEALQSSSIGGERRGRGDPDFENCRESGLEENEEAEKWRRTAEIIDVMLGGVRQLDEARRGVTCGDVALPQKTRRGYKESSDKNYDAKFMHRSPPWRKAQPNNEEYGESSIYEPIDIENNSEYDEKSDCEVSILAQRNEGHGRNQVARENRKYRDAETLNTSGPQTRGSKMRHGEYINTSGPKGSHSSRFERCLDTSGPVGGYSETNFMNPHHEEIEEEQNESMTYNCLPTIPKSNVQTLHQGRSQRGHMQVERNGGVIGGTDTSDLESDYKMKAGVSEFVDDECRRRTQPLIQSRKDSYAFQDGFYIENAGDGQDSYEESSECMKTLQSAKGNRGPPKKRIDIVKRAKKPCRPHNETAANVNGDSHCPRNKDGNFATKKQVRPKTQTDVVNNDEINTSQAADCGSTPRGKKRGRPAAKGKAAEPKKRTRTRKSKENVKMLEESSVRSGDEKSPVKKKAKRVPKKEISKSFNQKESKQKVDNHEVQTEAVVTVVTELKAKRGRKPMNKEGAKKMAKTPSGSNNVETHETRAGVSTESEKDERGSSKRRTLFSKNLSNNELSLNQDQGKSINVSKKSMQERKSPIPGKRKHQAESSSDYLRKKVLTMRLGTSAFHASSIEENSLVVTSTPRKSLLDSNSCSMSSQENNSGKGGSGNYQGNSPKDKGKISSPVKEVKKGLNNSQGRSMETAGDIVTSAESTDQMLNKTSKTIPEPNSDCKNQESEKTPGSGSSEQPELGNSSVTSFPSPSLKINDKLQNLPSGSATSATVKSSSSKGSIKVLVDRNEKEMELFAEYLKIPFHSRSKGPQECMVQYGAALNILGLGTGYIHLSPGSEKGLQNPKTHNMVFLILDGQAMVKIHESELVANPGDFFAVPKGCKYNLTAIGSKKAVIAYFKSKAI